jgi:Tfp pilus assembly PilM family ATPase
MLTDFLKKIDRFFPTPKFLSFDPVAIDITPRAIRMMALKKTDVGLVPRIYKEVKLKDKNELSTFKDEEEIDLKPLSEVVNVLKELKKEFKLKYVVVSLPETNTYIYRTKLPAESASDLASAIRFGLEENVPLAVDTVNFDYFVIDNKRKPGEDLDVVVSVFPKKIINVYTNVLKKAGLFPLSFQSESVSIYRSVVKKGDKQTYLLLRFLKDQVNVGVVEDGAIQYASIVNVDMDKVIADFNSEEAQELNEALNKVLIFWFTNKQDKAQHKKIDTALITGSYVFSPGIQQFLERKLKIKIEVANVWVNCFSTNDYIPDMKKEEAINYAGPIGLAIKGIRHA